MVFRRELAANHQAALFEGMRAELIFPEQPLGLLQIRGEGANADAAGDAAARLRHHSNRAGVGAQDQPPAFPRRASALRVFCPGAPFPLGIAAPDIDLVLSRERRDEGHEHQRAEKCNGSSHELSSVLHSVFARRSATSAERNG